MSAEIEALREELRALLVSPAIGLPDYAADPMVGRRIGRMLAAAHAPEASRKRIAATPLDPSTFRSG
jgi:hypothetical protein